MAEGTGVGGETTEAASWDALSLEEKYKLWAKHEDIAMHFNDLAMRLRLQALAGVGASALVAGSIFTHQGKIDVGQLGVFLMAVSLVWGAIFALDVWYYQALLNSAVRSIISLEKSLPKVKLSTDIKAGVNGGRVARLFFYGAIFALLFLGGSLSSW